MSNTLSCTFVTLFSPAFERSGIRSEPAKRYTGGKHAAYIRYGLKSLDSTVLSLHVHEGRKCSAASNQRCTIVGKV